MLFKCILKLYEVGEILIVQNLSKILQLCASIYETDAGAESPETRPLLEQLVRQVYRDMPTDFETIVKEMAPIFQENLAKIISVPASA